MNNMKTAMTKDQNIKNSRTGLPPHMDREPLRINKYLSMAGVCSRREADLYLEKGRVLVNGKAAVPGTKVFPEDEVSLDGKRITLSEPPVLLLFHKPEGIVCSTKKQRNETTVTDFIRYPLRVYPVGRLDKESEGLLLLTNQGELMNRILKAANYHEKEYIVTVDRPFPDAFLSGLMKGVPILGTVTRPCTAERLGKDKFRIILTQGLNRQIRRMCEYFGFCVVRLIRIRIMNLELGGLRAGEYRKASAEEISEITRLAMINGKKPQAAGLSGDISRGGPAGCPGHESETEEP